MKKIIFALMLIVVLVCLVACNSNSTLGAIQSFSIEDTLPKVNNSSTKVVLLYGQSNATGVASNAYLQANLPTEYETVSQGYDNVLINFITENGGNTSHGKFVKVQPGQGCSTDYFGPELGIASVLSTKYSNEQVFIIKYSWGGTVLNDQWLDGDYKRGELYKAALSFTKTSLKYLKNKGYNPEITAVCWMQGESDSFVKDIADRYYTNTAKFVEYLRKDLSKYYTKDFTYIDAGIAEIEEYWVNPKTTNAAKQKYADEHENCIYFSTEEMGLTTYLEPVESPDKAHYDSVSAFELGKKFASYIN